MRVYLDVCAIQRPLDELSQLRVRLEAEAVVALIELCETGRLDLVVSAAHEIENRQNPYPERQAHAAHVLSVARQRVPTTSEVAERAAEYEQAGLTRLDALHLAAAVTAGVDYFCTTDDRRARRARNATTGTTSVVSPLDLVILLP